MEADLVNGANNNQEAADRRNLKILVRYSSSSYQDDPSSSSARKCYSPRIYRQLWKNLCMSMDMARLNPSPFDMLNLGRALRGNQSLHSLVLPTNLDSSFGFYVCEDLEHFLKTSQTLSKVEFYATSDDTNLWSITELLVSLSQNTTTKAGCKKELIFTDIRGMVQADSFGRHDDDKNADARQVLFATALRNGAFNSVSCHCCSQDFTELVLEGLQGSSTLEKLYISPVRGIFQNNLAMAKGNGTIPYLSLAPSIARLFQSATPIQTFHFFNVWRDDLDSAVSAMAQHPTLQDLVLYGQHDTDPWLLAANISTILRENKKLERLYLSNLKFDPDSLFVIAEAMQQNESVKSFSMYRCGQRLKQMQGTLPLCRLDTQHLVLDMATLPASHLNSILANIRHSHCLEHLALYELHETCFKSLFTALAQNQSLQSLTISSYRFPTAALKMLATLTSSSSEATQLRHLTLRTCETTALELAKAMATRKECFLSSLRLFHFAVGFRAMTALLDIVQNNANLTRLHLRGAPLTNAAFICLCERLPELDSLKDLRFDWPRICEFKDVDDFVEALDKNRSLIDIGGSLAPRKARVAAIRIMARNRIRSLTDKCVPAGLWPRVFTCRGFASQPSLLCFVIKEVVGRSAWPTEPSRKRALHDAPDSK